MWGKLEEEEETVIPMGMDPGEPIAMEMDNGERIPIGANEEVKKFNI